MRDYNFFSPLIKTKKAFTAKYISIALITILKILTVGGFTYRNHSKAKTLEKEIMDLKAYLELKEVVEKLSAVEEKGQKIDVMGKYLETLENINVSIDISSNINSSLMEDIASTIPKDLFIRTMSFTLEGIQVQGISKERTPVAEFEHNLKSMDTFKEVHVGSINKEAEDGTNYIFSMLCTFRDVNKNEDN
jgi:type IV pilus assembly protein PilN